LELGISAWDQKTSDGAIWPNKKFHDIFSRLDTIHQCETDTWRQEKPHWRIVSRR